jgi:protease IV
VKSGPYKDILSFDRDLSVAERALLQSLIDNTYLQFATVVAENRNLPLDTVKTFADGRIFTGEQALDLGMVDRLGTEEDARQWVAELAGLDPDKAKTFTFEESKPLLSRVTGSQLDNSAVGQLLRSPAMQSSLDWLAFELETSGMPLWLYRP